jgi:hypothetical protein
MARRGARNETNSGGGINAFFESLFDVLGDTNKNNIEKLKRSLSEGPANSNAQKGAKTAKEIDKAVAEHERIRKLTGAEDFKGIVAEKAVETLHNATPPADMGDPLGGKYGGDMFGVTEKKQAPMNTPQEGDTSDPTHGEIAALQQRIQDKDQIIESLRSQIETMQRALSQGPPTLAPTKPVGDGALNPMAGLPEGRVAAPAPGALPGLGARPKLGGAGLDGGGGRPIDPRIALGLGG